MSTWKTEYLWCTSVLTCIRQSTLCVIWPLNVDARLENGRKMFCWSPPDPQHPKVSDTACAWVARGVAHPVVARLSMCDTRRSAESAARQTPVSTECSSLNDLQRHWLQMPERITFRLAVLMYCRLHHMARLTCCALPTAAQWMLQPVKCWQKLWILNMDVWVKIRIDTWVVVLCC